jgi:hypothetical protein
LDLQTARAKRWWQTRRPVRSIDRAAAFVEDVGFALLFPARGVDLPSLYNAATDRLTGTFWEVEWGPDAERVWGWKDELPLRGRAWYGKLLTGRASLLAPGLLADLYPRSGRPDDFTEAPLSDDARRIAEVLLLSGPTSTSALREILSMEGRKGQARFSSAVSELGRGLVVTNYGVEAKAAGWPAAVLELTARVFEVPGRGPLEDRHASAARAFLRTMLVAEPAQLARSFGWPGADARRYLAGLANEGEAELDGGAFHQAPIGRRKPGTRGRR